MFPPLNEQMDVIRRGASEIIPEEELAKKIEKSLKTNKPLIVKLGCDPSRPDLHIGHSVVLRKLAQFQELGHQAILIIGDFTGMIGDPTGRNATRPALSLEDTKKNGQSYYEQATKLLHPEKTQMVYNSTWLGKMTFEDVIKMASFYTVARMLERDDFTKRYKSGEPISIHEFLYPLAQAMDSVAIKSDVELGGTDQKFNLLVGRDLQREFGQEPQVILTMPLLVGLDGVEKMSKSYGNYIGISDAPSDMYGKTLSIADKLIYVYYELATDVPLSELSSIKTQLEDPAVNPRNIKRALARKIVQMYHGEQEAVAAEEAFDRLFIKKEIPDDIETKDFMPPAATMPFIDLLMHFKLVPSKSEARRLIQQGGATLDSVKITDPNAVVEFKTGHIIKLGKRKFLKLIITK